MVTKLQLIEPEEKYDTVNKYIETFDFDVLRSYFDGKKFFVSELEHINSNKTLYNLKFYNDDFGGFVKRYMKYTNRGFDILLSSLFLMELHNNDLDMDELKLKSTNVIKPSFIDESIFEIIKPEKESKPKSKFSFLMKCTKKGKNFEKLFLDK